MAGATVARRHATGTILNDDEPVKIEDWNTTLQANPDSAVAHFKRAVAYLQETGMDEQAVADLNRAIELYPEFALAYYNRGLAGQRHGELERRVG